MALGELPMVTYDGGGGGPEEHIMFARAELIQYGGGGNMEEPPRVTSFLLLLIPAMCWPFYINRTKFNYLNFGFKHFCVSNIKSCKTHYARAKGFKFLSCF